MKSVRNAGFEVYRDKDTDFAKFIIEPEEILIQPSTESKNGIYFNAQVSDETRGQVFFDITTIDLLSGERHPYFERHRASELAAHAIRYFEQGQPIDSLEFYWLHDNVKNEKIYSVNYTGYLRAKQALVERGITEQEAGRLAVFRTWTYHHIALPNGFTRLGKVEESHTSNDNSILPYKVTGDFRRPPSYFTKIR